MIFKVNGTKPLRPIVFGGLGADKRFFFFSWHINGDYDRLIESGLFVVKKKWFVCSHT